MIARIIGDLNEQISSKGYAFAQQYILHKGLKKFGQKGREAAGSEMDQLYARNCFVPISINELKISERLKAQEALMLLTQKRSGEVKGRMVYNGKPTRAWISREDSASPTVAQESIMLTTVIDVKRKGCHERRCSECIYTDAYATNERA